MNNVYNSAFELALRIILLLNSCKCSYTADRIAAVDTIAIYGKNFGIAADNLHGDSNYYIGEYAAKRRTVQRALKRLVLDGYVFPRQAGGTIVYSITETGEIYAKELSTVYAQEYCENVTLAVSFSKHLTDRKIVNLVSTDGRQII